LIEARRAIAALALLLARLIQLPIVQHDFRLLLGSRLMIEP
jgi:hypothetical protein